MSSGLFRMTLNGVGFWLVSLNVRLLTQHLQVPRNRCLGVTFLWIAGLALIGREYSVEVGAGQTVA